MSVQIIEGDCRDVLATLPAESVQCVVTSPPFYGLRDYGHGDQIGLEPTPQEYVDQLVAVFREVRRVLHPSGVAWLNLGDSYAGSWGNQGRKEGRGEQRPINGPMIQNLEPYPERQSGTGKIPEGSGLKPKDLIGIPWMVAFALRADGWYLRQDIIWAKTAPMPESVTDRCTKAHEYIFLMAKSERYFFDQDAIAEPSSGLSGGPFGAYPTGTLRRDSERERPTDNGTRNKRSVWTIGPEPYPGSHFAVFPQKLVEPCILAGTSEKGCCAECGAPWQRVTERTGHVNQREQAHVPGNTPTKIDSTGWAPTRRPTNNWEPTCTHNAPVVPCTVLDPFAGSGTTLRVAVKHRRNAIGIELNPDYVELIRKRLNVQVTLPFEEETA